MSVNQELAALVQRLEAVATRLENTEGGSSSQIVEGKILAYWFVLVLLLTIRG